jgi:uracil-DNA glycosylase
MVETIRGILCDEWLDPLTGFIESEQFEKIIFTIKNEKKLGFHIQPSTDRVFRGLNSCKPNDVKVIMAAQDPYNSRTKDGGMIADGLAFSCSLTKSPQPSLKNIYSGILKTTGSTALEQNDWDLEYLAAQGVLLINSSLTVRSYYPNSHKGLWDKFIDEMFFEVINKSTHPIVYIMLGKEALNTFSKYIRIGDHILSAVHPAAASYTGGIWDCKNIFNECNKYLELEGLTPIKW